MEFNVGDRIGWTGSAVSSWHQMGEIIRVDTLRGKVVQYVVFTDSWYVVTINRKELVWIQKIPLRMEIKDMSKLIKGRVVKFPCGYEGPISEILPNNFVLKECINDSELPIPVELEYLKIVPNTRVRSNVECFPRKTHLLRYNIPKPRLHSSYRKHNFKLNMKAMAIFKIYTFTFEYL